MNAKLPLRFAQVHQNIYRSSYPTSRSHEFLNELKLCSMICISPDELKDDLINYCKSNCIELYKENVGVNIEPFYTMPHEKIRNVINKALDPTNQPCLIFCTTGKVSIKNIFYYYYGI